MKRKQFNKKSRRRAKLNLVRKVVQKKLFSKRMGGIIGNSVLLENRNINAGDLSTIKNEIL